VFATADQKNQLDGIAKCASQENKVKSANYLKSKAKENG